MAWFDGQHGQHERRCVANFLMTLAEGIAQEEAIPLPGDEDLSLVSFVPGTDLVVTYMPAPELDVVFIDSIEPLDDPEDSI